MKPNTMELAEEIRENVSPLDASYCFWIAELMDGSVLSQYIPRGDRADFVTFQAVLEAEKQGLLGALWLVPFKGPLRPVGVFPGPDRRIIFFNRRYYKPVTGEEWLIHVLGWQETVRGRNVKCLLFIYPDGMVVQHYNSVYPEVK